MKKAETAIGYYAVIVLTWIIILLTFPFSMLFCIRVVQEYKRMVVFRLGRLRGNSAKGPGIVLLLPCIDEHYLVDLRTMCYDVPSQEMLTRDSVTVSIDAAVYFKTRDPIATIARIADAHQSTKQLAQTTLRNIVGTRTLSEIMLDREGIACQTQEALHEGTNPWGIQVESVELKDIRVPTELCRALATEAEAAREADAKVVSASGEFEASVVLKQAADKFVNSPAAVQLRYLQTLGRIAAQNNHTIIMPIPTELIRSIYNKL
uniref:PHB domain-containing protein n=1 Tax=Syphacia muris TaxID=451379 RepID=A0A0N5AWG4_9BILA